MRNTWELPDQPSLTLPSFKLEQVLVEYDGPQIVTLSLEPKSRLYLGVASDESEGLIRWILAPVTRTEIKALLDGAETLRDALLKPTLHVLDGDFDAPFRAWICDGHQLGDDNLPERGALLPRLTREELAYGAAPGPELCLDGPNVKEHGIGFRALSEVLSVFQRLWTAIADTRSHEGPKDKGPWTAGLRQDTALGLMAAEPGSLVLRVSPANEASYERVAQHFEDLARAGDDQEALAEVLGRLGPRVQSRYNELLTNLEKHDLQMLTRRPGGAAFLSAFMSPRVLRALPHSVVGEPKPMMATGHFIAFDTRASSFVFYDEQEEETYSGSVHPDVVARHTRVEVGPGARYTATLDVTTYLAHTKQAAQAYTFTLRALGPA